MKEINKYYKGYSETKNKIDKLKFCLLNEYGPDLDESKKETYNLDNIIKTKCNHNTE